MTGYLAVSADLNIALDLDKRTNAACASDTASVKVHESGVMDNDTLTKYDIGSNHLVRWNFNGRRSISTAKVLQCLRVSTEPGRQSIVCNRWTAMRAAFSARSV